MINLFKSTKTKIVTIFKTSFLDFLFVSKAVRHKYITGIYEIDIITFNGQWWRIYDITILTQIPNFCQDHTQHTYWKQNPVFQGKPHLKETANIIFHWELLGN